MEMLGIVVISGILLTVAYFTYGRLLSRLFELNDKVPTPAVSMQDDVDYVPCDAGPLLNQHFSAIAAAGPIVGPILAGIAFGWLPALLWILFGSIFIGGVHDFAALVASIRHRANSIIDVVRVHISQRAYMLFLIFVWMALVYIVVAFTDITANMFVGALDLQSGKTYASVTEAKADSSSQMLVQSGGVATSSLIYLVLPIVMGLLVRSGKLSMWSATVIFSPLVILAILVGPLFPLNVDEIVRVWDPNLTPKDAAVLAVRGWDVFLLVYCALASVTPMWLLLQPRGQLGGLFLYGALGAGAIGLIIGGLTGEQSIQQPMFRGWVDPKVGPLFPFLFITIACGACSGFHSLIASGTTSKQLRTEQNARTIGYGAMLLEAMVAIVSLCCVMLLPIDSQLTKADPNFIYANGISTFLEFVGIPRGVGLAFALMAFNTFVYDTLDVCTRLGRMILQELLGWQTTAGRWVGTIITAGAPVFFVTRQSSSGKPLWQEFWGLFGASNQLLAALTLIAVTVWLWRTRRAAWTFLVTGLGAALMYTMSSWALVAKILERRDQPGDPVTWIAVLLLVLGVAMLVEAIIALLRKDEPPVAALATV
jgi:carbon starvation protein